MRREDSGHTTPRTGGAGGLRAGRPAAGGRVVGGRATVAGVGARAAFGSRPRGTVHAASGKRLGDAHPRQEGPLDLRLVPPALAAWATAASTLDASPGLVGGLVIGCLPAAGILLVVRRGSARNAPVTPGPGGPGRA